MCGRSISDCWLVDVSIFLSDQDKDVTEASGRICDLTERLRDAETSLTESRSRENKLQRDLEENKRRYRDTKHEVAHLKGTRLKFYSTSTQNAVA